MRNRYSIFGLSNGFTINAKQLQKSLKVLAWKMIMDATIPEINAISARAARARTIDEINKCLEDLDKIELKAKIKDRVPDYVKDAVYRTKFQIELEKNRITRESQKEELRKRGYRV